MSAMANVVSTAARDAKVLSLDENIIVPRIDP
jgi:hypothetical protein